MKNKRETGDRYEQLAVGYLEDHGYSVIERNFRCRMGEIDIVAKEGGYLVFAEVKYRSGKGQGEPLEAVNFRKQQQICKAADVYRVKHGIADTVPCRFDVVGILGGEVSLLPNAFSYVNVWERRRR